LRVRQGGSRRKKSVTKKKQLRGKGGKSLFAGTRRKEKGWANGGETKYVVERHR